MKTPMTPFWARRPARHRAVIYIIVTYALLSACGALQQPSKPAFVTTSGIRLYLQPLPQEAQHINFSITRIAVLSEDGTEFVLTQNFDQLISRELIATQKHLAASALPVGSYRGIRLWLGGAEHLGKEGSATLQTPTEALFIEQAFEITRNKSQTLFLSLKPNDLLSSSFRFTPTFYLTKPSRILKDLMGFISNTDQNCIFILNKNTMQIANAILMQDPPNGLAINQKKNRLYVAQGSPTAINVMDFDSAEIIGKVLVSGTGQTDKLLLGKALVAADYNSRSVSIISPDTLEEKANLKFSADISSVVLDPSGTFVYVFHARSELISKINLETARVVSTEPIDVKALTGTFYGDQLYMISENWPNLSILGIDRQIAIGFDATAVTADTRSGLVYVGKQSGEILVIDPLAGMVIDGFQSNGTVETMIIDHFENTLFVVSSKQETIQKFDLVSYRVLGAVETGVGNNALVITNQR